MSLRVFTRTSSTRSLRLPRILWALPVWLAYIVLFGGYAALRGVGDEFLPVNNVGAIEEAIFRGSPSRFLQGTIYDRDVPWLDFIGYAFHASWFMGPYVTVALLLLFAPHRFVELLAWLLVIHYAGAVCYTFVPVEPPWMNPQVSRVLQEREFIPYTQTDNNTVAAFPSLHCAVPMMLALFSWIRLNLRMLALAFGAWGTGIAFFVVYLGEHWVIDVAGGWALAGLVTFVMTNGRIARGIRAIPGDPAGHALRFNRYAFPARAERTVTHRPVIGISSSTGRRKAA